MGSIQEECEAESHTAVETKPEVGAYFKSKPARKLKFIPRREPTESDVVKSARSVQSVDEELTPVVYVADNEYSDAFLAND